MIWMSAELLEWWRREVAGIKVLECLRWIPAVSGEPRVDVHAPHGEPCVECGRELGYECAHCWWLHQSEPKHCSECCLTRDSDDCEILGED